MNKNPTVDIIVPFYNNANTVSSCLDGLLHQSYKNIVNIFLVNDGSTDDTLKIINSTYKNSIIKVINHKRNLGLSAARNSGIRAGSSDVILFLDGDMAVQPNWVKSHIEIYNRCNVIGVVGDHCLPLNYTPNKLDMYLYNKNRGARKYPHGANIPFRFFLFSNTSIKRSVVDDVGCFDEEIKTYGGEDTEFAIRIWKKYPDQLVYSQKSLSQHFSNKSLKKFLRDMKQYGSNGFSYIIKKHPEHKNDIGGQYVSSVSGRVLFNPILRNIIKLLSKFTYNYYLIRYLVVDAVVLGARKNS